ncbi:MAG: hypothetical protein KBF43_09890 [Dermatophilaceae bacterium]|nr:hypothetical protein [Dermatophilaceae bacterium]
MSDADVRGVVFPFAGESRSTSAAGRAIVADALRPVDPIGAQAAAAESGWRTAYPEHFRRLVVAGLSSPEAAVTIAQTGAAAVHEHLAWASVDGSEGTLAEAVAAISAGTARKPAAPTRELLTETQRGTGAPERTLKVPYRGARLEGSALRQQLDDWVTRGIVEPSVATAVGEVIDNPDWLDLSDRKVVVLGAGAEMGPLRSVLRWGGEVVALDVPRPDLWRRLLNDTRGYAGWLHLPVRPGPEHAAERAGANLVTEWPLVGDWIMSHDGPLVIGNYVYADGANNVRVCAAVDALTQVVSAARPDTALGFLATPTDVFAVPGTAVSRSVAAYQHATISRAVRYPLRALSGGRLLTRNYVPGSDPGLNDSIVPQQGPNYLLAKRLQRWRATAARAAGTQVSLRVAPPTRTRSVVKNRALAAAYAGAHRFGLEVFEPATSNTLMAALLVHDLRTVTPALAHPWEHEAHEAVHGGLWTAAYAPRSALGLAAMLGLGSH